MQRSDILNQVTDPKSFQFWVPVITHYRADGSVDAERMQLHARQIQPHTRLWMVAGTTGDGWNLTAEQYSQLLDYALESEFAGERPWIIVGALQPDTAQVLERIGLLKERLGLSAWSGLPESLPVLKNAGITGVTICTPVGEDVSQAQMVEHISQVCEQSNLPIVVYQLPQVTRNLIAPETLAKLVENYPQIIMFKDSSGSDDVAASGLFGDSLLLVRGAEGRYLDVLKESGGWYDGWLLSTGNAFAAELVEIYSLFRAWDHEKAAARSRRLTGMVERIFRLAQALPSGNAFSNANRAADHLLAFGKEWKSRPLPLLQDGSRLPQDFIAQVEEILPEMRCGYAI